MGYSDHFEDLEEQYQEEHAKKPYSKQEYARSMHEKELAEMSEANSHMTLAERRAKRNSEIYGHGWNLLAYHREYAAKVRAHEEAKAAMQG